MPPEISVTLSTSRKVSPPSTTGSGGASTTRPRPRTASWMALTPSHGRAECADTPRNSSSALTLPRQPACRRLSVGSITTARVACRMTGQASKSRARTLSDSCTSSRPKITKSGRSRGRRPRSRSAASCSITASAPFMSAAPSPWTTPASSRPGRLPWAGTVSECPASTTSGRPGGPNTIASGRRWTMRMVGSAATWRAIRSVTAASCRLTEGTFTSSSVSRASSPARSAALTDHGVGPEAMHDPARGTTARVRPTFLVLDPFQPTELPEFLENPLLPVRHQHLHPDQLGAGGTIDGAPEILEAGAAQGGDGHHQRVASGELLRHAAQAGRAEQIRLVEGHDHRLLPGTQLLEHLPDDGRLSFRRRRGRVHDVQDHVRIADLLQGGPEGGDQVRGQLLDEADGVGGQHLAPAGQAPPARGRVQSGEQAILGANPGTGERIEQGRLARVGVAHDGDRRHLGALAAGPLLAPLGAHLFELAFEVLQTAPDAPTLDLDLLLARPGAGPDAAHLAVVVVGADQAREEMAKLGRLHLQASLTGTGVLSEDVQDQLGPIHHPHAQLPLQVPLLAGAQVLVADDQVVAQLGTATCHLGHLAPAHVQGRVDLVPVLDLHGHHLAAGGTGQLGQLPHLLVEGPDGEGRRSNADQIRALTPRSRLDQRTRSRRNSRIPGTGSAVASNQFTSGSRRSQRSCRRA